MQPLCSGVHLILLVCLLLGSSGCSFQSTSEEQTTNNHQQYADPDRQQQQQQQQENDEYLVGVGIADITGPAADINLVSLIRLLGELAGELLFALAADSPAAPQQPPPPLRRYSPGQHKQLGRRPTELSASSYEPRQSTAGSNTYTNPALPFNLRYPTWRELQDVKLQFRINLNSFLFFMRNSQLLNNLLLRWAMPNQIKMQAEFTYANFVVQL